MSDDLSRIVGKLEAMQEALEGRLDRQDHQHAQDKAAAIRAREAKEARDNEKHVENQRLWTETHALATRSDTWITKFGQPMTDAWFAQEQKKAERRLVNKGRMRVYGSIGAGATGLFTLIGFLGRDAIAAVLKKIGEVLS
jgi:thiamine pyrophosphate-dependent acetolactate synthase large subunit-like protein